MVEKSSAKTHELLIRNSIDAALASIEIYNKPNFPYREQIFTILIINAWELLLKAKIIKDNGDQVTSIYALDGQGKPKTNRTGNPLTIELITAMRKLEMNQIVAENLTMLIDIRDTAIHYYHDDSIRYLTYTLGVASLRNYQKLVHEWFGKGLLDYNFYILPLAFAYDFKTLSLLQLEKKPEAISNVMKVAAACQSAQKEGADYYFICEVATEVKTAKSFVSGTGADFTTAVDQEDPKGKTVVVKTQRLIDKYPLSYAEVSGKVRVARPGVLRHQINQVIREFKIKSNVAYSAYNFRTHLQEETYKNTASLPKGVTSIYNDDAVRFIVEKISP
ncbi:MAG: hypothetical protein A3G41_03865 [Elusimicrobia bacterium RIFCSPLOWO2_12_FULL_59_9]|nr:MAG: hypothetical protein A3G41_03865 [Elusimicrobia bacterium RIFCSPLOWO2_12_FULL_59_9]